MAGTSAVSSAVIAGGTKSRMSYVTVPVDPTTAGYHTSTSGPFASDIVVTPTGYGPGSLNASAAAAGSSVVVVAAVVGASVDVASTVAGVVGVVDPEPLTVVEAALLVSAVPPLLHEATIRMRGRMGSRRRIRSAWQTTDLAVTLSDRCCNVVAVALPRQCCGDVAEWFRQGPAKPCTWVRFPSSPLNL